DFPDGFVLSFPTLSTDLAKLSERARGPASLCDALSKLKAMRGRIALQKRYAKGGTCCPQRVGERIAALPPNICAFGNRRLPSSSEKSIHKKARNSRVASRVPDHFLTFLTLNPFAYGVGRGNGVGLGLGVGGGRVADGVGVTLGVTVVVAVAVAVAVGVAVAVAVAVGVGVNVAVAVGVGLGLPQGSSHLPAFTITLPQSPLCVEAAPT